MNVLTCNTRCYRAQDGKNDWPLRKEMFVQVVRSREPDIICCQEVDVEQFVDLSAAFPEFEWYGMVDTVTGRHPQNSVFYRSDRFKLISAGGFWLSQTPHVAGSKSWDSDCIRLANWVRLVEVSTGIEFRVVNTHLDHIGQTARENQARLIVEDSSAYPDEYPQLLTGDMNCDHANAAIKTYKKGGWQDTYAAIHGTEDPGHTFHAFMGPEFTSSSHRQKSIGKMDWIFYRGKVQVTGAEVVKDSVNGRFPSDHYFVAAVVNLGATEGKG